MPTRIEPPSGDVDDNANASTWPVTMWPPSSSPTLSGRSRLSRAPSRHRFGGGAGQGFARNIDREPVVALVDDRQAHARAGDRGAEVDAAHVIPAADGQPQVAALLGAADGADVGDDPGEHGSRLAFADPLVNFEPVGAEPPLVA